MHFFQQVLEMYYLEISCKTRFRDRPLFFLLGLFNEILMVECCLGNHYEHFWFFFFTDYQFCFPLRDIDDQSFELLTPETP